MNPEQGLQVQIDIYRRMTGQQRLQIAFDLAELTRELVRSNVRNYHADWSEQQVDQEVVRRFRLAAGVP
jgi:hypothetical protein